MRFYRTALLFLFAALVPLVLIVLARVFWPRLIRTTTGDAHDTEPTPWQILRDVLYSLASALRHTLGGALFLGIVAFYYGVTKTVVGPGGDDLASGLTVGIGFAAAILGVKLVQSEVGNFLGNFIAKALASGPSKLTGPGVPPTSGTPGAPALQDAARKAFNEIHPGFLKTPPPKRTPPSEGQGPTGQTSSQEGAPSSGG